MTSYLKRTCIVAAAVSLLVVVTLVAASGDLRGRTIFSLILRKYPGLSLYLQSGLMGENARLVADVPREMWKTMTTADRHTLASPFSRSWPRYALHRASIHSRQRQPRFGQPIGPLSKLSAMRVGRFMSEHTIGEPDRCLMTGALQ